MEKESEPKKEEVQEVQNSAREEKEEQPFVLYKHIKNNIKQSGILCRDPITEESYYCFDCNVSTCPKCTLSSHKDHKLISKLPYYKNSEELIEQPFQDLNNIFSLNPDYLDVNKSRGELKILVDKEINELMTILTEIKKAKLDEIDSLFSGSEKSVSVLKDNINTIKKNIHDFFQSQKQFFNLNLSGEESESPLKGGMSGNNDYCNMIFLLNYDMLNVSKEKNALIKSYLLHIKDTLATYDSTMKEKVNHAKNSLALLKEPFNELINYPKLENNHYKEIKEKIAKYNEQISGMKKQVFDSVKKTGNLEEIDNQCYMHEARQRQNIDNILNAETNNTFHTERGVKPKIKRFSSSKKSMPQVDPNEKIDKAELLNMASSSKDSIAFSSKFAPPKYNNQEDINLSSQLLQKYFAFLTLDLVKKNFYKKKSTMANLLEDDFDMENDIAKPIPETNQMQIYDRKTRSMIKKKVPIEKSRHKYNYFLTGSRSVLVKDRLYITGGVDKEKKETSVSYVYYLKTNELKQIPDMANSRAYHSILFLEHFKSILVVGGENNATCEVLDLYNLKWKPLPNLNYPRANSCLYFDRMTTIVYSCFGILGNMSAANTFTDVFECLELKKTNLGWGKVEYKNKTEMDFKNSLCRLFPIGEEKILIYGASAVRESKKKAAIFNISKSEIVKIDNNTFNEMRLQAKKSAKLNKIISTFV